MEKYTFTDLAERQEELFKKAVKSPILLKDSSKEYVIISAETYKELIGLIAKLEKYIESVSTFVKKKKLK